MLVVLNGLLYHFAAETHLRFHFRDEFGVHCRLLRVKAEVVVFRLVQLVKWVLAEAVNIYSLLRISYKDFGDNVFRFGRKKFGERVVCGKDLFVKVRRLLVFVGQEAAKHGVQHHSDGPNVRSESVVAVASDHLQVVMI